LEVKLTLLLKIFFEQKGHSGKNEQPGVLGQKSDDLAGGFEQEARDRANQPGQQRTKFRGNIFEAFPKALPVAFKPLVRTPMTAPIVVPAARRMAVNVTPYFLKISLTLSKRGRPLSLSAI